MKKLMMVILVFGLIAYAGTKLLSVETASGLTSKEDLRLNQPEQILLNDSEQISPAQDVYCANPLPGREATCRAKEQAILDATVRLYIYTSLIEIDGNCCQNFIANGYATIKDGRYLVTHNHFNEEVLSILRQGDPNGLIFFNVIAHDGNVILTALSKDVSLLATDRESVVLDFGLKDGEGIFTATGLVSATFEAPSLPSLQPGMEVAQINWDGSSSYVQWTKIESVKSRSGTPVVKLSSCILKGASGGGLFWQGVHIGNNWSTSPDCGPNLDSANYSFVALNSQMIVGS